MSNKGHVVIKGKLAPIIGIVCMDAFMVDVTDIEDVKIGDEVFIWDNDKITVEDIAKNYDTINYEVIATISKRVIREYI
jgi:alanine racemase